MNKKTYGVLSGGIATVLLAIIVTSMPNTSVEPYEETFVPGAVPPATPVQKVIQGTQSASIEEAGNVKGSAIKSPKYLPHGYSIKHVGVDGDMVTILVSKFPVKPETTDQEFVWGQKGITVYLYEPSSSYDTASEIEQTLKNEPDRWYPVDIKGKKAAGHDIVRFEQDGEIASSQAELLFYDGTMRIYVTGMVPLQELVSIAASFSA